MKTSNLKIYLLLIVLFLISLPRVSAEEKKPVHVGALLSLSGGLEQWCNYIKQGINLAASEEGNEVIKITYEDDRSIDLKSTVSAARKLIDHSKVDLLFSWSTAVVPVLVPLSKKNHLPLFIGGYDKRVANGGDYPKNGS
jgi:ABC-type branched-subunit amino acid transport system substrate-binding protein